MDYLEYDGVEPYKPYSGRLNLRMTSELILVLPLLPQPQALPLTILLIVQCRMSWLIVMSQVPCLRQNLYFLLKKIKSRLPAVFPTHNFSNPCYVAALQNYLIINSPYIFL